MIKDILNQARSLNANQFIQAHKNSIEAFDGNLDVCSITLIVERSFVFIDFVDEKYFNHAIIGI